MPRAWVHELDRFVRYKRAGSAIDRIHIARAWCTLARVCEVKDDGRLFFEDIELVPTLDNRHCGPRGLKHERKRRRAAAA